MTSIVLDYVERQKLGGTNLTFQFLFQLPILTRDELRYILDPASVMGADYPSETFRVLKQKEERLYGDYRTERLVLEAWDRLSADWGAVGLGEGA